MKNYKCEIHALVVYIVLAVDIKVRSNIKLQANILVFDIFKM